tara:strand:- start:17075 stop:17875 length:801 start_codon:yes stop_codon:yes gene_type:complete
MQLSAAEKKSGLLTDDTLARAVDTLQREGFVILEEGMARPWVEAMRTLFTAALHVRYRDEPEALAIQRNHGGFQPPLTMPFLDPSIIENSFAFQVLERVLGDHFFGCLPYGCNTAFPGSEEQNVHRDCGHLFPELDQAMPPMLIVVNILLDDFTKANGATEIWPGSQRYVDADKVESRTLKISPSRWSAHASTQTIAAAGSIVIRDMRTWHRGMANTTAEPRTMLSLVYYRQYAMPDNLHASDQVINTADWAQISERAKWTYRLWQ